MIEVAHCRDAAEAYLIKGALDAEGISAVVIDEHLVGVNWLYSDAVGGVKVAVKRQDEARAVEILERSDAALDPSTTRRSPGLPRIAGLVTLLAMAAVAIPSLLVGIPMFARRKRTRGE